MRYKAILIDKEKDEYHELTEKKKCIEDVLKALYNSQARSPGKIKYDEAKEVEIVRKPPHKADREKYWNIINLKGEEA